MILLDHNIPEQHVEILRQARLRPQQVGREVGRPEWLDFEEILRYLHQRKFVTFLTRDDDFFRRRWGHANYSNELLLSVVLPVSCCSETLHPWAFGKARGL